MTGDLLAEPTEKEAVVEETIENWKRDLPESFSGWPFKKGEELVTREEVLIYFDKWSEELKENKHSENDKYSEKLHNGEKGATNNFHMFFSPKAEQKILDGKFDGAYGIKPFYINERFNGAWNRMCEQFPHEIELAVGYSEDRMNRPYQEKTEEENAAFIKLALYLGETEGVVVSFLCR